MENLFIGDRKSSLIELSYEKNPVKLFTDITSIKRPQALTQGEYIETIEQGVTLMRGINPAGDSILVFDMANPFSLLLKAKPPEGDYSFFHYKRNINTATRLPEEILFKSVKYVMIPKLPMAPDTSRFLKDTYSTYINEKLEKIAENMAWEVYKKRFD